MIKGIFHTGSGLGNQLHRYVATRVLALDKGYRFGMCNPENFKGTFMQLDMGDSLTREDWELTHLFTEKKVVENGVDIRGYDPEINFVADNTTIDGEFQDSRYFEHRMDEIAKWLAVEPLNVPKDLCVIGFRGGEYTVFPDLFLTREYWLQSINTMKLNGINRFEVHTDDIQSAKNWIGSFLSPETEYIHDMGLNWRAVRYAKYAIIANSSFYILPRLIKHSKDVDAITLAPRYWARRNTKVWALPQNYYRKFTYL